MEGLRVQAPDTACLDPAEGWERPNRARVDDIVKQWAPLGAGKVHVDALLDKLRNPKAVGRAPRGDVLRWVNALASAVASGRMDYGSRFAYGGFNLASALPFVGVNTWSCPSDRNMVTDSRRIIDAASSPAVDSQFTLFAHLPCLTKVWENAFVASVFDGRNVDLRDVGGKAPDGHPSFNECPGYKAADASKYPAYFEGTDFPPEPAIFGSFPPVASLGATAYVLTSGVYPILSVNGKGPSLRTLRLIKDLGGVFKKLDDASARELGSRYGLNGIEYADNEHYGLFIVFMRNQSQTAGHLMLITLNPQFGTTMGGAHGGGSAVHAEMLFIIKTQAEVIRSLSDCDHLDTNRAHPLWQLVGDLGMRPVFAVARKMSEADALGERYATRHVRAGLTSAPKTGFGGTEVSVDDRIRQIESNVRGGAAHVVRDMPKTTCPFCKTIDVRLTWYVRGRGTVTYKHKRFCDGKTKQQTFKINEEEVWREFLHELQQDQFDKHKADVLREGAE